MMSEGRTLPSAVRFSGDGALIFSFDHSPRLSCPDLFRASMNTSLASVFMDCRACPGNDPRRGERWVEYRTPSSPSSSRNSLRRISGIGEPGRSLVFSIDGSVAPRSRLGLTAVRDDEGKGYPDATPAKDIAPRLVPLLHEHKRPTLLGMTSEGAARLERKPVTARPDNSGPHPNVTKS